MPLRVLASTPTFALNLDICFSDRKYANSVE
jgi:hypothetical protein